MSATHDRIFGHTDSIGRWNGLVMAFADPTPGLANDHYTLRPFGQVRIAAFQVSRAISWVEVDCVQGPTDISRLIATDLDDQDQPLSEKSITLRRGERARITWGKGPSETDDVGDANGNGVRDIFLDEDAPTKSGDQIVLMHNGRMLEAVVFADQPEARFSYPEQKDVKALVERQLWQAADATQPRAVVTGGGVCRRVGRVWANAEV